MFDPIASFWVKRSQYGPVMRILSDRTDLAHLYCSKLVLCYLFQDFPQAAANAQELEKYLNGVVGTIIVPLFNFYDSLTVLALYSDALPLAQAGLLEKLTVNQAQMQKWAHHAPANWCKASSK
ncbi:hypothetical protein [Nostoc sp.]|uniref:hypothetical protein n=1 Tax=Nostoc sp. TaxID=1180 RepID=UPI002FF80057